MNVVKTKRTYVGKVDWNWREIVTMLVILSRMILSHDIVQSYDTCGQIISKKNSKNVSGVWGGNNTFVKKIILCVDCSLIIMFLGVTTHALLSALSGLFTPYVLLHVYFLQAGK